MCQKLYAQKAPNEMEAGFDKHTSFPGQKRDSENEVVYNTSILMSRKPSSQELCPAGSTSCCYCWPILTLCYFHVHWRLPPCSSLLEPRISLVDPICSVWLCAGRCVQYGQVYGNIGMKTWNESGLGTVSTHWNNGQVFTLVSQMAPKFLQGLR